MTWAAPKYPGDAVRIELLRRDNEIGDVRIQDYSEPTRHIVRVATFLPGRDVDLPGDTPKVEPEKSEWVKTNAAADALFDRYVAEAHANGWTHYDPNS